MKDIVDISWFNLLLGYGLLILPLTLLWYFKTGLTKATLIALLRMTVQLFLVGLYLQFIFTLNNALINILWIAVMLIAATYSIIKRSGLKARLFWLPVFLAVFLSIALIDAFFLGWVIRLPNVFDARYLIPITGMIIGNTMKSNIIAMNSFYRELSSNLNYYHFALANGATRKEALQPYLTKALQQAFNPIIATMSVVGLIALPGMMTGQILSGTNPEVAIRYQIMIMISIFIVDIVSVLLSILFSNLLVFDAFGRLKTNPMKN